MTFAEFIYEIKKANIKQKELGERLVKNTERLEGILKKLCMIAKGLNKKQ